MATKYLPKGGTICDFGAGTGLFLTGLGDSRPDAKLYAVEPYMPASADTRIRYVSDFSGLSEKLDLLVCFETCEHLSDDQLNAFLEEGAKSLRSTGTLIVSVPIMMGPVLLLKELNRAFLFRRKSDYSLSELIAGTFARPVERAANRLPTHKGFDFRWLRQMISQYFTVEEEFYSPLPLPWWANSQVFLVCRPGAS
nr:class I SAM-dependent methyltransferase [Bradyrhizobium zhanjiangense]